MSLLLVYNEVPQERDSTYVGPRAMPPGFCSDSAGSQAVYTTLLRGMKRDTKTIRHDGNLRPDTVRIFCGEPFGRAAIARYHLRSIAREQGC